MFVKIDQHDLITKPSDLFDLEGFVMKNYFSVFLLRMFRMPVVKRSKAANNNRRVTIFSDVVNKLSNTAMIAKKRNKMPDAFFDIEEKITPFL